MSQLQNSVRFTIDFLLLIKTLITIADGWNLKAGMNIYGSFRCDGDAQRQLGTFGNDTIIQSDTLYLEVRFDF